MYIITISRKSNNKLKSYLNVKSYNIVKNFLVIITTKSMFQINLKMFNIESIEEG